MENTSTTTSLELLLLNDLLHAKAIDETVYNMAFRKILMPIEISQNKTSLQSSTN